MTAKQAPSRFSFFVLAFIHSKRVGFVMAFYMYVVTVDLLTLSCLSQTACFFPSQMVPLLALTCFLKASSDSTYVREQDICLSGLTYLA